MKTKFKPELLSQDDWGKSFERKDLNATDYIGITILLIVLGLIGSYILHINALTSLALLQ